MSGAIILDVHVTPNRRKTAITKTVDGTLFVDLHAKPENNEANDELERFLTKHYQRTARIILGKTSKRKTVRVE